MPGLGLGLGIQYGGVLFSYDSQAVTHYNRVIADGGTVPAGLAGTNAWFVAVKGVYGTSDITTAISSGIHPHYLGYKAGSGSGATLGSAAQICYNAIGSTGDIVQTTAASQPLILPHTGTNYVWLPGLNGNFFSTPNATANQITGNIGIIAKIRMQNYNVASTNSIVTKRPFSGDMSYAFQITSGGTLFFRYSSNGVQTNSGESATSSVSLTSVATNGQDIFVGMFRNAATGKVDFYYSLDGVSWPTLGTQQSTNTGNMFNSSNAVGVGNLSDGLGIFLGRIYQVDVSNSWQGSNLFNFNPANYNRAVSQSSWTSTTGEVWTNNMLATNTGFKSMICDTTLFAGNGTSVGMRAASLNMNQAAATSYTVWRKFSNAGSGTALVTELGANVSSGSGKYFGYGFVSNNEEFGINGNVGLNNSRFTSTSLDLKLSTYINNIANANESLPLLTNNVSQSFVTQDFSNNNTANMNATGYNLFSRNNAAGLYSNAVLACDIVSKQEDDNTQRTAIYNVLDGFLNNAL